LNRPAARVTKGPGAKRRAETAGRRHGERANRESQMKSKPEPSRDPLIRTTPEGRIELTEEELSRVSAGYKVKESLDAGGHVNTYDIKGSKAT
jgi:hypothetical protein